MEDFIKRNQPFRTIDAVSVLVLFAVVMSVSGAILSETFRDDRPVRAKASAEALAHQIIVQHLEAAHEAKEPQERSIASVDAPAQPNGLTEGTLGKDPWGRPFRYFVQLLADPAKVMVFVWSDGPNGIAESSDAVRAPSAAVGRVGFRFRGDDLGHVESSEVKL